MPASSTLTAAFLLGLAPVLAPIRATSALGGDLAVLRAQPLPGIPLTLLVDLPVQPPRLTLETLDHGFQSLHPAASTPEGAAFLFEDAASFETFHALHAPGRAVPAVDFDRELVLVAFLGRRTTTGARIDVRSVRSREGRLRVRTVETRPGEGCFVLQAGSRPFHIVRFRRVASARLGRVLRRVDVKDCSS